MYYNFGNCKLDTGRRELLWPDQQVRLTPRVFNMLLCLLKNRGRVVTKQEIVRDVWEGTRVSPNTADRCIAEVRRAIRDDGRVIRTVHGHGYMFDAMVEEQEDILSDEQSPNRYVGRPYVFVSYSHEDSTIADEITSDLSEIKIEYFLDRKDIHWGESISRNVREALRKCTHQIIILSPASVKSSWVHFETGFAIGARRIPLPFLTHKSLDMPKYFEDLLFVTTRKEIRDYFLEWVGKYVNLALEGLRANFDPWENKTRR